MGNKTLYTIKSVFNIAAGLSSIAGLIVIIFKQQAVAIVIACVCVFLVAILASVLITVYQLLKKENPEDEWLINFVFNNYLIIDDEHHEQDIYKIIQCKRPCLTSVWHKFKWSGTEDPKISSDLQTVGEIVKGAEDDYDKVKLTLKQPLYYNQMTTCHFHAELNDGDRKSGPFLQYKIATPLSMVLFKVTLKNKSDDFDKHAVMERVPISNDGVNIPPKVLKEVPFDKTTKSYTYPLMEPEPGFFYQLRWEK